MKIKIPSYYKEFKCIADKCKDSCCIGWEINIDQETYEYYQTVPGEFGERLRSQMSKEEENSFRLNGKRCPFLNQENLCEIILNLDETSLCEVCTEYPRFTLEYGDCVERCLALSCEEAARLIFESKEVVTFEWLEGSDKYEDEMDKDILWEKEIGKQLGEARDCAISLLQERNLSIPERITGYLEFCNQVQVALNEERLEEFLLEKNKFRKPQILSGLDEYSSLVFFAKRMNLLEQLEVLDVEWEEIASKMKNTFLSPKFSDEQYQTLLLQFSKQYQNKEVEEEQLLVYYAYRYLLKAVFDSNFLAYAKFGVFSYLVIRDMNLLYYLENGEFNLSDRIDTARIYCKEVEHSEENLEFLADASLFESVLKLENLKIQVEKGVMR